MIEVVVLVSGSKKGRPSLPNNLFNVKIFLGAGFVTHGMEKWMYNLFWTHNVSILCSQAEQKVWSSIENAYWNPLDEKQEKGFVITNYCQEKW